MTQPAAEEVVAARLAGQGWRVYLPRYRRILRGVRLDASGARHRTRGAGEVVLRPLFPGYLFIEDQADHEWCGVKSTRGVLSLLGVKSLWLGWVLSMVDGDVVEAIREAERLGEFDELGRGEARPDLEIGSQVRLAEMHDMVGRLVGLPEGGRADVLLEIMGRSVRVKVGSAGLVGVAGK